MILFVGQIDRGSRERDTFQEVDYRRMFGGMAKWVAEIDDPARIPEFVHRAFATATPGRPGPGGPGAARGHAGRDAPARPTVARRRRSSQRRRLRRWPSCAALLATAERPFVILGGGGWNAQARRRLRALPRGQRSAGRLRLPPPGSARQRAPLLRRPYRPRPQPEAGRADQGRRSGPGRSAPGSARRPARAITLLDVPRPAQGLVHVHNDPEELGRVYQPDLAITGRRSMRSPQALAALPPVSAPPLGRGHAAARMTTSSPGATPDPDPGPAAARRDRGLAARAPARRTRSSPTAPATTRSGPTGYFGYRGLGTQLAPTSGSMGYGLPAAIAAKLRPPRAAGGLLRRRRLLPDDRPGAGDRRPVRPAARRHRRRQRHVRHHPHAPGARAPGPGLGTALANPDFAALARAYRRPWRAGRDDRTSSHRRSRRPWRPDGRRCSI